jgi:hypothetical protein
MVFKNPYDILLLIVYIGYLFTALLAMLLLRHKRIGGLVLSLVINAVIHANLVYNGTRLVTGYPPASIDMVKQMAFLITVNLAVTLAFYFILRSKNYAFEIPTAIGLFLSSVFFTELYIPVAMVLVVLLLPIRQKLTRNHA